MSENNYSYEYEPVSAEPAAPKTSVAGKVLGIIGMVLGISGIAFAWAYGAGIAYAIPGIILSIMAKKKGETKFSKIGTITSVIGIIASVLFFVLVIILAVIGALAGNF